MGQSSWCTSRGSGENLPVASNLRGFLSRRAASLTGLRRAAVLILPTSGPERTVPSFKMGSTDGRSGKIREDQRLSQRQSGHSGGRAIVRYPYYESAEYVRLGQRASRSKNALLKSSSSCLSSCSRMRSTGLGSRAFGRLAAEMVSRICVGATMCTGPT